MLLLARGQWPVAAIFLEMDPKISSTATSLANRQTDRQEGGGGPGGGGAGGGVEKPQT